jgi:glycosidase
MKRIFSLLLTLAMLLSLAGCVTPPAPTTTAPTEPVQMDISGKYPLDKTRNEAILNDFGTITAANSGNARVYYQIFVGSFSDSNGDGLGDLRGIINRFDYLNDGDPNSGMSLGIEGIWLSPIFTSPTYHKYDCNDYYEIDPKFGTMEDLKELVELCHARGVQIILDLVVNHTSTRHVWFQKFLTAHQNYDDSDPYYDFYTWGTGSQPGRSFHKLGNTSHFYEGNFSNEMPELNYDNPNVRQAMVDVAKFYLDLGVDGFRFDAAKYIYYGEAERNTDFWDWYMGELRSIKPDVYSVAEVWDGDGVTIPYNSSTNCFNFTMSQVGGQIAQTAANGDPGVMARYIESYLQQIRALRPDAMLCSFIANHDMDRTAGFLPISNGRAFVGANLNILTPGSPFIYYGEEIGLRGSRGGANTDANRRLAMLWGDGDTVKDPIGADYDSAGRNGTVADQLPNGKSLYNHYKKLIAIRQANPEIAYGEFKALELEGTKAGGFLSTWQDKTVCVLHNTSTAETQIDLSQIPGFSFESFTAVGLGSAKIEGTILTLDGQTSVVLR